MARWNDLPWRDDVYAAAEIWRERCLLQDKALFSDQDIWTLENLLALLQRLQNLQKQKGEYWDKLAIQMKDADPAIIQLKAELLWFMRLFPIGKQLEPKTHSKILVSTKRKGIERILSWGNLPIPETPLLLDDTLLGIGKPGPEYLRNLPYMELFLTTVICDWKRLAGDERAALLEADSAFNFATYCDKFLKNHLYKLDKPLPIRHALLFFLFPDSFERMVSFNHKKEVVRDYWHKLSMKRQSEFFAGGGFQAPLAIDKAIFSIRKDLEQEHGTTELDFYHGVLDKTWGMENKPFPFRPQAIDPPTRSAGQTATPDGGDNNRFENLEEGEVDSRKMSEGQQQLLQHYRRERRPQLRDLKLKSVEKDVGFLQCECCGTAAEAYPPEYRRSVFEVHHKRPLSEGSTMTGVDDLALLCANCHRAIHVDAELPPVDLFKHRMP